jgi:hypothetical protein
MKAKFAVFLVVVALIFGCIGGYVTNIVKLCGTDFEPSYKAEVIRGVGVVVPPVGVVLGYVPASVLGE